MARLLRPHGAVGSPHHHHGSAKAGPGPERSSFTSVGSGQRKRKHPHRSPTSVARDRRRRCVRAACAARPRRPGTLDALAATYVRDMVLPEEFFSRTMIVTPSARTGLRGPGLLRGRVWFLLDQPYGLKVLKAWVRGLRAVHGVGDSAICQVGQPIYVGRPRFIGMDDPDRAALMGRGRRQPPHFGPQGVGPARC